jgi:hypothetical protein
MNGMEKAVIIAAVGARVEKGCTAFWEVRDTKTDLPVRGHALGTRTDGTGMGDGEGFFNIPWPGQKGPNSGIEILEIERRCGLCNTSASKCPMCLGVDTDY